MVLMEEVELETEGFMQQDSVEDIGTSCKNEVGNSGPQETCGLMKRLITLSCYLCGM